jgi:hypothetical protein
MRQLTEVLTTSRILRTSVLLVVLAVASLSIVTGAQRDDQPAAPPSARAGAPIDITGYWVSIVTEDWRYRMVTPKKGDYASVPMNAAARQVADAWDPTKEEASGGACKSYGAANIMRVPGRAHITWQDDNTLKIELDAGTQTRLLHFTSGQTNTPAPAEAPSWQGYSVARWQLAGPQRRGGNGAGAPVAGRAGAGDIGADAAQRAGAPPAAPMGDRGRGPSLSPMQRGGSLNVVTTHLKAGYLRKNGVPYSDHTVVTEFFDRHNEPNGDQWFTVTTIVEDPTYLLEPFITSSSFKKEPSGAKWRPAACSAS